MLRAVVDTLFPMRCASCAEGPWPFCDGCRAELVVLRPPGCARCGMPAEHELGRCGHCPPDALESARAPFLYAGPARAALLRLKFRGVRAVADALARAMEAANRFDPDALTWVPLSPHRKARRGYDQARALATSLARRMGVPAIPMLSRAVDTGPQTERTGAARRRAMRGVFRAVGRAPPARVLLIDDVLTTGATAGECARVLVAAGSNDVALLTAARATPGPLPARCYTPPRAPA